MISKMLEAMRVDPHVARQWAPPLQQWLEEFKIPQAHVPMALAQWAHETAKFTRLEEVLYYTTEARLRAVFGRRLGRVSATSLLRNPQGLANVVYANRGGNGPVGSGDGWRYRGRGATHLTFRGNYERAAAATGMPLVAYPEMVAQPSGACATAAWYYAENCLGGPPEIERVTRAINGPALEGIKERAALFARARAVAP